MAFNSYFPAAYNPNYYGNPNPYYQQMQNQLMQQQAQQAAQQQAQPQQPTIQQSGFVLVRSEQEAQAYPVAPGNSITFKDETRPYCYVKTMGFSSLDRPTFERYRLVKEDALSEPQNKPVVNENADVKREVQYALKSDLGEIWGELDALKEKLKAQTERKTVKARKIVETEAEDDE